MVNVTSDQWLKMSMDSYFEGFRSMRCVAIAMAKLCGQEQLSEIFRATESDKIPINQRDEEMIQEILANDKAAGLPVDVRS